MSFSTRAHAPSRVESGLGQAQPWRRWVWSMLRGALVGIVATAAASSLHPLQALAEAEVADRPSRDGAFVFVIDTTLTLPESTDDRSFLLPLISSGRYDAMVAWGDGTEAHVTGWSDTDRLKTYSSPGRYTVTVRGLFQGWSLLPEPNTFERLKLLSVVQWGSFNPGNQGGMFAGAANLVAHAQDAPDLTGVWNLSQAFKDAKSFNGLVAGWAMQNVTSTNSMFAGATTFNQSLAAWDTSQVRDMGAMFAGASSFDQPLATWNTSNAIEMSRMFAGASAFDQPLATWETGHVVGMAAMFDQAVSFNRDLGSWDTRMVRATRDMFAGTVSLCDRHVAAVGSWLQAVAADLFGAGPRYVSRSTMAAFSRWRPVPQALRIGPHIVPCRPSAPQVRLSVTAQGVRVAWQIQDDGGSSITSVLYSADGGSSWQQADSLHFIDVPAHPEARTVLLRAVNTAGWGDLAVVHIPPSVVPAHPANPAPSTPPAGSLPSPDSQVPPGASSENEDVTQSHGRLPVHDFTETEYAGPEWIEAGVVAAASSARVIYRQVQGRHGQIWRAVVLRAPGEAPKPGAAPRPVAIPPTALITVVTSSAPRTHPSTNVTSAMTKASRLARRTGAQMTATPVRSDRWRGQARIIVNW